MLRQGKSQGWLSLSPEAFHPWTQLNGVRFHDVRPGHVEGRGSALLASKDVENSAEGAECLLTVPKDLILSQEQVHEQAKVDRDFRELLESLGDFGRVGGIFLSSSHRDFLCPSISSLFGRSNIFSMNSVISWVTRYIIFHLLTFITATNFTPHISTQADPPISS